MAHVRAPAPRVIFALVVSLVPSLVGLTGCAVVAPSTETQSGERHWSTVHETLALEWPLANGTPARNVARLDSAKGAAESRSDGTFEFALELHWRLTAPNAEGNVNAFSAASRVRLAYEPTAATWFVDGAEQGLLVAGLTRAGAPFVERIVLGRPRERMEFDFRGGLHIIGIVPGEPRGVSRRFEASSGELPVIRGLLPRLPGAPADSFHAITLAGESMWCVHAVAGSDVTFVGSTPWDLSGSYTAHSIVDVDGQPAHRLAARIEQLDTALPRAVDFVDTDGDGAVDEVRRFDG